MSSPYYVLLYIQRTILGAGDWTGLRLDRLRHRYIGQFAEHGLRRVPTKARSTPKLVCSQVNVVPNTFQPNSDPSTDWRQQNGTRVGTQFTH